MKKIIDPKYKNWMEKNTHNFQSSEDLAIAFLETFKEVDYPDFNEDGSECDGELPKWVMDLAYTVRKED